MKSLLIAAVVLFSQFAFAQRACFFQDINFQGGWFCATPGQANPDLRDAGWSKRISSVRIEGAMNVKLYSNPQYSGNVTELNSSVSDLRGRGWNDVAMSFMTFGVSARVCFFVDDNYKGASFCAGPGREAVNMVQTGWNDKISSIRVDGNASAKIWEDIGFNGRMLWVRQSVPSLRPYQFNDLSSSVKIQTSAGQ